ncbi:MAG TPA: metallophosphoesterase [Ktedonobacteraceae bacterium]
MTYAIGDLHGEVTLLQQLLTILPLREQDTLVFLGDYMDRGEDSIATILALAELQRKHKNCVFLRGNHDDAWLAEWDGSHFQSPPDMEGALNVWDNCNGKIPFFAYLYIFDAPFGAPRHELESMLVNGAPTLSSGCCHAPIFPRMSIEFGFFLKHAFQEVSRI